ncbi:MAG: BrnA antitoxin family protein [Terriglobales bacterium]
MSKRNKPQNDDPEWTAEDIAKAVPFQELPASLQQKIGSRKRGPQKAPTKELISIRLSRDVVERLRASGRGWQARVDAHLRDWLKRKRA